MIRHPLAAGLALQTCEPWMSGLAASGYMMVRQPDGTCHTVAFPGCTPLAVEPARYPLAPEGGVSFLGFPAVVGDRNVVGWEAVAVPGAIAGLGLAAERFGRLGWDRLIAPAIDLLSGGIAVDWHATLAIALAHGDLNRDPAARADFLPGGSPPQPEKRLQNPALLESLRLLAAGGPGALYSGALAERLLDDFTEGGSVISAQDLQTYSARIEVPQSGPIPGGRLYAPAKTSGGQRLLETLGEMGGRNTDARGYADMARALQAAHARHRARIQSPEPEGGSTTHLNVIDAEGRIAALTFTLLNRFGSRVMGRRTGILMNNGMAWFDPRPGFANSLAPGAVAHNNMCPVIAERADGSLWFALGASGGNQIVPALAQIAWFLGTGQSAEAAMHQPRLDTDAGASVRVMPGLDAGIVAHLSGQFDVTTVEPTVFPRPYASVSVIVLTADGQRQALAEIGYPSAAMVAS